MMLPVNGKACAARLGGEVVPGLIKWSDSTLTKGRFPETTFAEQQRWQQEAARCAARCDEAVYVTLRAKVNEDKREFQRLQRRMKTQAGH